MKESKIIKLVIFIFISTVIFIGLIMMKIDDNKIIKIKQEKIDSLQYIYTNASDSLQRFTNYKVLYTSIMARDNATKRLKYQVGDIVYCKPDSVKSVITDIIIGGSKYDYYVRYKIKSSLDSIYEVIPEQIY